MYLGRGIPFVENFRAESCRGAMKLPAHLLVHAQSDYKKVCVEAERTCCLMGIAGCLMLVACLQSMCCLHGHVTDDVDSKHALV